MSTTTCFCGEIRKILCGYPLLSGAMQNIRKKKKKKHFGLAKASLTVIAEWSYFPVV